MCVATGTAANVALGAQGFSAAAGAVGSYYSAQSNKASLELQSDLAEINARTAESAAQSALFQGQRREQASRLQTANLKGAQRTAMAANGIDLGEGTAARVLTSTDVLGEIDANTIAADAVRTAWGYRTQGTNYRNEAAGKRAAGSTLNPLLSGATSLLSGAGSVASTWYQLNKVGAFGRD